MGSHRTVRAIVAAVVIVTLQSLEASSMNIPKVKYPKDLPSASELGVYKKAAVAANGPGCAKIGSMILKEGGSAVDAAIATLLCDGVVSVHSMGIGGGFLMTIYDPVKNKVECLNAREEAPSASSADMFTNPNDAQMGGKSIAVPGELHGYWEAHKKYGKLPWAKLFQPTIKICEEGSVVNEYIAESLRKMEPYILAEPTMSEILIDPATNRTWEAGTRIRRTKLAKTLKRIADSGSSDLFYNGTMAKEIVQDIKDMGGIMKVEDFNNYRAKWVDPISMKLGANTLYSVPPPGSGAILAFIMKVLHGLIPPPSVEVFWHRLLETFKWAYAKRSELGDPDFVENIGDVLGRLNSTRFINYVRNSIRDDFTWNSTQHYGAKFGMVPDAGTANVCVFAPDGSAVTVTSTINQYLGAMRRSPSTGIIFNDEMDDFSSKKFSNGFAMPPSPANYIAPHKRPMSSMAPSIIINNKNKRVRMLVGSAGGTKITTAIATTIALHMYAGFNVKEAIDAVRIHHQLLPNVADYEPGFNPKVQQHLMKIGHNVQSLGRMGSTVTAISVGKDEHGGLSIKANSDGRRQGSVAGY